MSNNLSWVSGFFCASHRDERGSMHGHTYKARAFWPSDGTCAVSLKFRLDAALDEIDHSVLPDELARAENIAAHIGQQINACRVDVWRQPEGMGARWFAK